VARPDRPSNRLTSSLASGPLVSGHGTLYAAKGDCLGFHQPIKRPPLSPLQCTHTGPALFYHSVHIGFDQLCDAQKSSDSFTRHDWVILALVGGEFQSFATPAWPFLRGLARRWMVESQSTQCL